MIIDGDFQWLAGANFDTENPRIPMSEEELKMSFKMVRSVRSTMSERPMLAKFSESWV